MSSAECITVALVEDDPTQRTVLSNLIDTTTGFKLLQAFETAEDALRQIPKLKPDVVLMDIHLPGHSGIDCTRKLKLKVPDLKIMMLTVFEDHDRIFSALKAGATGYLLKRTNSIRLLEAIRELHEGGAPMSGPIAIQVVATFQQSPTKTDPTQSLTDREREILHQLTQGFQYKQIADSLSISIGTVRTHVNRVYEKLHVHSRAEAMLKLCGRE